MTEAAENQADVVSEGTRLLPPKFSDPERMTRLLPPTFKGAARRWDTVDEAEPGKIRLPNGDDGYVEIDANVVYVFADGKKIPIQLADRHAQWRQRAIFNLIAMLICLGILYLGFLLIAPKY
jgi:hypothetical protein